MRVEESSSFEFEDWLALAGLGLMVLGLALIYVPLALLFAGFVAIRLAFAMKPRIRKKT